MIDNYNIDMSENIFGGLNDTVSEADSDIPNVNPTALSPTEELIKKFEPFEKFIKIGHANTVSVPKNRDDIEVFLNRTGMDLFATSETNIHKNTPNLPCVGFKGVYVYKIAVLFDEVRVPSQGMAYQSV